MKIPISPPNIELIYQKLIEEDRETFFRIMNYSKVTDDKNRYLHWEKLRFLEPPTGFTHELWWAAIKIARRQLYKALSINNYDMGILKFAIPDKILEELHWLDKNASGTLTIDRPILNTHMKNTYLISSLIEESIRSSQLEGAATTRRVAKKMIQEGRKPRDKDEQMIFNNFSAMQFIREIKEEKITPEIIKELHKILVENTQIDESKVGRYREKDDEVYVVDEGSLVLYTPPNATEIKDRIEELCRFANEEKDEDYFIHPVIRSILLHFLFSYIHPFIDGNGRTARAIFYWSMLKQGYWLTEFISISKILKMAPAQYSYSFLFTESDENDITYFIDYQLSVIHRAIDEFRKYVTRKITEIESIDEVLKHNKKIRRKLNHRQYSIIKHALKHPGYVYSINEHKQIHGVAYDTARKDLLVLSDTLELLLKIKDGRSFTFISPMNLKDRISEYDL